MDMIRHPAVGMQAGLVSLEVRTQQILEDLIVGWLMEDRLAMVSTQDRVIETVRDVGDWCRCYGFGSRTRQPKP
jgi:hypothetical protein